MHVIHACGFYIYVKGVLHKFLTYDAFWIITENKHTYKMVEIGVCMG